MEEFLKKWFYKEVERVQDNLLENYPEEYDVHYDEDYIDGRCVRRDIVCDEDKVLEDAKDSVIEEVVNKDISWESLFDNEEFLNVIVDTLKGM